MGPLPHPVTPPPARVEQKQMPALGLCWPGLTSLCCLAQHPASVTHQQPGLEDKPGSLPGTPFWHFLLPAV